MKTKKLIYFWNEEQAREILSEACPILKCNKFLTHSSVKVIFDLKTLDFTYKFYNRKGFYLPLWGEK